MSKTKKTVILFAVLLTVGAVGNVTSPRFCT